MPTTTIRYDEQTKDAVVPMLESIGLSINSYLNLALRQLAIQGRVPFAIIADSGSRNGRIIPGTSPKAKKVNGKLVFPADWDDGDDE